MDDAPVQNEGNAARDEEGGSMLDGAGDLGGTSDDEGSDIMQHDADDSEYSPAQNKETVAYDEGVSIVHDGADDSEGTSKLAGYPIDCVNVEFDSYLLGLKSTFFTPDEIDAILESDDGDPEMLWSVLSRETIEAAYKRKFDALYEKMRASTDEDRAALKLKENQLREQLIRFQQGTFEARKLTEDELKKVREALIYLGVFFYYSDLDLYIGSLFLAGAHGSTRELLLILFLFLRAVGMAQRYESSTLEITYIRSHRIKKINKHLIKYGLPSVDSARMLERLQQLERSVEIITKQLERNILLITETECIRRRYRHSTGGAV